MTGRLPSLVERRKYLRAAVAMATASRRAILRRMARGYGRRLKADATLVTDADLEAERVLRREIGRRFPEHGIFGEEFPAILPNADFQWILDPIDGTLSFTHGIPFFGTIIALHYRDRPIVGVIDHPALGVCYSAGLGLGAWCDGRRLRIRDARAADLPREIVSASDRPRFVLCRSARAFDALVRAHANVRGYTDCLAHTMAAEGKIGAAVDYGVRLWDIAATQLLIEEAGGRYECVYRGRHRGLPLYGIICGKPRVVRWLLRVFGSGGRKR
ncbi:MAG TPA: inositol monophosphatase family protein [Gemmatimonadales bacterium]|nr:inositol monophosphatase family protein [Gemmatimonadales bacterium]